MTSRAGGVRRVDLEAVASRLAEMLEAVRGPLSYAEDRAWPRLEVAGLEGDTQGGVAMVAIRRRYVAYTLVPVYLMPDLVTGISDRLRRTFNGKAIFRLRAVDDGLIAELRGLTAESIERYRPYAERKLAEAAGRRHRPSQHHRGTLTV